ncbi:MAG: hypothetical protein J7578_04870 [Chitinophagaceae bacterium]|nr:hypothetical protein [Chitinophagaceae bacterium]
MKKLINRSFPVVLMLSFFSCKDAAKQKTQLNRGSAPSVELKVDGVKKTEDPAPVISSAYTSSYLLLSYLSEKDDIQFSISAYMPDLKPGTFQVYDCKSASECGDKMPDNQQTALYGPFIKDPMPALNLFRSAYYAPKLGLSPLTFTITSVTDEQQAGNPFKTKRIQGKLNGVLAFVEQQSGRNDWHIVGKTTQIEGNFNVLSSIR